MSVPSDKPRSRPFLMELAIALALLWAGLNWALGGAEDGVRTAAETVRADPPTTGSVRPRKPPSAVAEDDAVTPGGGAVRGLLDAFTIIGRR